MARSSSRNGTGKRPSSTSKYDAHNKVLSSAYGALADLRRELSDSKGAVTERDQSPTTDANGAFASNDDRDSTRRDGVLRASWELTPELAAFAELAAILRRAAPRDLTWTYAPRRDLKHHTIFRATKAAALRSALWQP